MALTRRRILGGLICLFVALAAGPARAGLEDIGGLASAPQSRADGFGASDVFSDRNTAIEYWAGSGRNEAVVVIDFGIDSYAFGYRWDEGTKSGKDLLDAVAAAGALDYTESGGFLATLSYGTHQGEGQAGWPDDWWSYFVSADGVKWAASDVGFTARELSNGVWDGWARQTTGDWPAAHLPVTPVPEPCTVALLGLGALFLVRRGR